MTDETEATHAWDRAIEMRAAASASATSTAATAPVVPGPSEAKEA